MFYKDHSGFCVWNSKTGSKETSWETMGVIHSQMDIWAAGANWKTSKSHRQGHRHSTGIIQPQRQQAHLTSISHARLALEAGQEGLAQKLLAKGQL